MDEPKRQAYAALAKAKFAMDGDAVYPDATFTLRLSYGKVQGWTENGREIPYSTRMGGTFDRVNANVVTIPYSCKRTWGRRVWTPKPRG